MPSEPCPACYRRNGSLPEAEAATVDKGRAYEIGTFMNRLLILLAVVMLTGCVASSKRLAEVRIGMNQDEVMAILGEPHSTSARADGTVLLRYQLSGTNTPMLGASDRRFADGYTVQLKEGKVMAYGKDDEFRALLIKSESAK